MHNSSVRITKPIFIVGMNGSGTTMLADCLNHHPYIYIHKLESRVIPFFSRNISEYGDLLVYDNFKKLLEDFSNIHAFRLLNDNKSLDIPFDFEHLNKKDLAQVISLTFSYFASKEKKSIWGDHSPKYAFFIPLLIDLFPHAKIIHIMRDGRDCAQSFNRRFGQNIYRSIFLWKKLLKKAREDGQAAGKEIYFELKYEDLTEYPELHMRKICSFLEVPFDNRVLVSNMPMYTARDPRKAAHQVKTIVPNAGKWRTAFTKHQIKKLEAIAGAALGDLEYEVVFSAGNRDIAGLKLFFWKWSDRINASIAFHKMYTGRDKISTFLRRVKTSFMQDKVYK